VRPSTVLPEGYRVGLWIFRRRKAELGDWLGGDAGGWTMGPCVHKLLTSFEPIDRYFQPKILLSNDRKQKKGSVGTETLKNRRVDQIILYSFRFKMNVAYFVFFNL
jgi:hypothetical protein